MKKKALALLLALCMVIAMLPATVFAAPVSESAAPLTATAVGELAPASVEPNAKSYSVTLTGEGNGIVELLVDSPAQAGSEVYFAADPDDGYLAYIYCDGVNPEDLVYVGAGVYGFIMPANKVTLKVEFVAAEGEEHRINVHDNGATASGQYALERSSAKQYESVLLGVYAYGSSDFKPEELVWAYGADVYYLFEQDSIHYYEIFMGDEDVNIFLTYSYLHSFKVSIRPVSIFNGTVRTDVKNASTGTEVFVYATPDPGYRLEELRVTTEGRGFAFDVNYVGEEDGVQVYSFLMPPCAVMIDADFVANINPITVTVETGLGGSAFTNVTEAKIGDTVTLICQPEEGYRVARITGVDDLVDNGDNTYTFPMPGEAVNVKVLFLRHENPFLDVNETQFFYDSVLWAVEQKITNGLDNTHFDPFGICNRAQVVTFLWRYLKQPVPGLTEHPFTDVQAASWYEQPVLWAVENGITNGATPTTFNPDGQCQRAQVVTFLYRTAQLPPPPTVYALHTQFDAAMGNVTLSHTEAAAGETITATVVPNEGYMIESVSCLGGSEVTQVSDGAYTFVMPEGEETFSVTFAPIPAAPVKTFELDLRDNGSGTVSYVDGKTTAAPGESIFFYAVPNEGYYLDHVGIFNPDGAIDVSTIMIHEHGNDLYELIMIPHDLIMTCYFYPNP